MQMATLTAMPNGVGSLMNPISTPNSPSTIAATYISRMPRVATITTATNFFVTFTMREP